MRARWSGEATFTAGGEAIVFLAGGDGVRNVDFVPVCLRWVRPLQDGHDGLDTLRAEGHPYRTAVLDAHDRVDGLLRDEILRRSGWFEEEFGDNPPSRQVPPWAFAGAKAAAGAPAPGAEESPGKMEGMAFMRSARWMVSAIGDARSAKNSRAA